MSKRVKIILLFPLCLMPYYFCLANVLASTDFNAMNNFWNSNTIVVAFGRATQQFSYNTSDMLTFSPGDPAGTPPAATPIQELTFNFPNTTEYMIRRNFLSNITSPTILTVRLQARFKNGQVIDAVKTITLNGTVAQPYDRIAVDIRGQIKDFETAFDNYHISIW